MGSASGPPIWRRDDRPTIGAAGHAYQRLTNLSFTPFRRYTNYDVAGLVKPLTGSIGLGLFLFLDGLWDSKHSAWWRRNPSRPTLHPAGPPPDPADLHPSPPARNSHRGLIGREGRADRAGSSCPFGCAAGLDLVETRRAAIWPAFGLGSRARHLRAFAARTAHRRDSDTLRQGPLSRRTDLRARSN